MNNFIAAKKFYVDCPNKLKKTAIEYFGVNCYAQNRYAKTDDERQSPMGLLPMGLAKLMPGFEHCWMSEGDMQKLIFAVESAKEENVQAAIDAGKAALLKLVANPATAEVGLQGKQAVDAFQIIIDSAMDAGDEAAKTVKTKKSTDGVLVFVAIGPGTSKLVKDLTVGNGAIGKKTQFCTGITVGVPSTAGNGSLDAKKAYAKAFSDFIVASKISVGDTGNYVTATAETIGF